MSKDSELKTRELLVRVEHYYGQTTVYPVCRMAKLFAYIAGCKTLPKRATDGAIAMGFTIKNVYDLTLKPLEQGRPNHD